MKIAVVYIYAPAGGEKYDDYAMRFLESYHANPPGCEHETVIVLNGTPDTSEITCLFSSLPNVVFLEHDNSGYDIGGFQLAARSVPCDLMMFFGSSTFYKKPGWLARMIQAYERHGPAIYGATGNRGHIEIGVWPHIRTTSFWLAPELMNQYPNRVRVPKERYPFEHGQNCFTQWAVRRGMKAWVVTWSGEYEWALWDTPANGFHRGDQSDLLACDRVCEPPFYPDTK